MNMKKFKDWLFSAEVATFKDFMDNIKNSSVGALIYQSAPYAREHFVGSVSRLTDYDIYSWVIEMNLAVVNGVFVALKVGGFSIVLLCMVQGLILVEKVPIPEKSNGVVRHAAILIWVVIYSTVVVSTVLSGVALFLAELVRHGQR
jgi:hypothetical protein